MNIGIDLGGSHIGVGLVDENCNIILKKEIDINEENKINIEMFIEKNICEFINEILIEKRLNIRDIKSIGIAAPGRINKETIIKSNNLYLEEYNIVSKIKSIFNTNVILKNDAKCATIAEKRCGCFTNYSNAILLTIGTGIGAGVIINNQLLEGKDVPGYEIGHMIIEKNKSFEQLASIKALREKIKANITGKELIDILNNSSDDENIQLKLKEYVENISIGIANVINIFEPEILALGGSFPYYKELLLEKIRVEVKKRLFNEPNNVIITTTELKNDAGIIGASLINNYY